MYVRLALADLRTKIVRRSDHRVRLIRSARQNPRDTEVAELEDAVGRQKHVSRLQVCLHTWLYRQVSMKPGAINKRVVDIDNNS